MSYLSSTLLAEIPWGDGVQVLAFGLSGVFLALGLLAAGVKVSSMVITRMEASGAKSDEKKG